MDPLAEAYKLLRSLWCGLAGEDTYELLEHEPTLELLDRQGKRARLQKRQMDISVNVLIGGFYLHM